MMAPPAYLALQELSLIEIRQMGGVYSESAQSRSRRRWEWLGKLRRGNAWYE